MDGKTTKQSTKLNPREYALQSLEGFKSDKNLRKKLMALQYKCMKKVHKY